MATCRFTGVAGQFVNFTPISTTLNNLPNGAGTLAVLVRRDASGTDDDVIGLVNSARTDFFHTINLFNTGTKVRDDDGITGPTSTLGGVPTGTTADDFVIVAVDWPSGVALERFHFSSTMGSAESWTHTDSIGNKGADRAGPGTSGRFMVGDFLSSGAANCDIALMAAWVGTRFTDTDATNLWINKKTSDWCNHPAGQPTLLVELNTLTPVDIGAAPSTFASAPGVPLTGLDPTGWTFDGCLAAAGPEVAWIRA